MLCFLLAWPLALYNFSDWHKLSALDARSRGSRYRHHHSGCGAEGISPQREIAYWLAVAHRRAGHISVFQDSLKQALDLGYPEDELQRQYLLMQIQSGAVSSDLEQAAEKLVEAAEKYSGPRVDLYIDEFYEARARGYLANYRLFDADVTLDHWVEARPK